MQDFSEPVVDMMYPQLDIRTTDDQWLPRIVATVGRTDDVVEVRIKSTGTVRRVDHGQDQLGAFGVRVVNKLKTRGRCGTWHTFRILDLPR